MRREVVERKTVKVLIERKTFLIRLEGDQGESHSIEESYGVQQKIQGKMQGSSVGSWLQQSWKRLGESQKSVRYNAGGPLSVCRRKRKEFKRGKLASLQSGSMHRSYAKTVSDEGPRGGGLVPVGRWARVVICESKFDRENWAEVGRLVARSLGKNGVLRVGERNIIQLRRWSPKENAEIDRKFREGWIELRGLPFHLWSEVHLKKIVEQWGAILPAMLEVTDGDWVFTVVVVVVGDEERRRGSEKGESTRVAVASHMETGGGRRGECSRSTEEGRYRVGEDNRLWKEGNRGKGCQLPSQSRLKSTDGMDGIGEEGGVWAGEDEDIADVGCRARERKAQLMAKTDPSGAVMGCKIKDLLGLGLSPDEVTPVVTVASSREEEEDASSANEKVKSAPGLLEFQSSRLAEKKVVHGSRKRWSTFFPPSSEHRQGIRSNSEPISRGKIKVDSEEDPKTDDFRRRISGKQRTKC
ncbi:hypothetical protein CK203_038003 [Vitis vinifera]|uniref:Uncharacterized protein n=1 Tax=Vitis vinifera TaxID=29760 RepID=A0A438HNV8_VITVI|nr:hypothetical protein CK203_038003 [Vitis vinifera]